MKIRADAATDVAAIGAWDASLGGTELAKLSSAELNKIIERDAVDGLLFFFRIGADWGGSINVYVDEELPEDARRDLKQAGGEFGLSIPTGRLVIDGLEFYRTKKGSGGAPDNALKIPAGNYALRFYESLSEGGIDPPSRRDLGKLVGATDSAWFQRLQWAVLAIYAVVPVLFFVVRRFSGWVTALLTALIVAGIACVTVSVIKSTPRYKRVAKAQYDLWHEAQDRQSPMFVFALRKMKDGEKLAGGWVDLRK